MKKKLCMPAVLAVVVLAGCGESHPGPDASVDASMDAGSVDGSPADAPPSDAIADACGAGSMPEPESGLCLPPLG